MQNGWPELFDEISEAQVSHNEDKRPFVLSEREFGKQGNVQVKISFF